MKCEYRNVIYWVCVMTLLVSLPVQAVKPQVVLHRNPFQRPAVEEPTGNAAGLEDRSPARANSYLRAVLVDGTKSVVDFGGVILQIGESTDGYRLLSVEEDRATFRKEDKNIVFPIYQSESSKRR